MQLEGGLQPHSLPDQPEESGRRSQDHVEHQQAIIYPSFILFWGGWRVKPFPPPQKKEKKKKET